MSEKNSYRDILRSSSIMGGANVFEYLVGLLRVKVIAVLLGPGGVGLVSLYVSVMGLLGTASGFGINSSGVREVALAYSSDSPERAARTITILRRVCWATGLVGWLIAGVLAMPISNWMFDSSKHAWAIAMLGATLLLGAISGGQKSVLQGQRRIGDIARINVIAMLINTGFAIGLYYWLRERGIVPVLLVTAVVSLGVSFWFSRKIIIAPVLVTWPESLEGAKHLAMLGFAFMVSGLLTTGLDMATRTIIIREYSIEAAGLYQAAWSLSGLFAGFILGAMSTDFYPRLTSVIHDHAGAARIVNEQTEIGILLALPGLLGTLTFASLVIQIFYSKSFLPSAELLPWFVLGVLGRVISWPLAFIQLAKGAGRLFVITESIILTLQLLLVLWMVPRYGIIGAAYTFVITYFIYTLGMLWVARALIGFVWSVEVRKILFVACVLIGLSLISRFLLAGWQSLMAGGLLTLIGGLLCLRELLKRLRGRKSVLSSEH